MDWMTFWLFCPVIFLLFSGIYHSIPDLQNHLKTMIIIFFFCIAFLGLFCKLKGVNEDIHYRLLRIETKLEVILNNWDKLKDN